jgi:hypothetical protein
VQSVLSQRPRGYDDRYVHMTFPGRRLDTACRRARLVPRIKGTHEGVHPRLGHRRFHLGRIRPSSADTLVSLVLSSYINPLTSNACSWLQQLGIYLAALLLMKLFVLALFAVALDDVLLPLAGWILNWMQEWSQVVFVMAVFPLFMNIIQVCSPRFAPWTFH